MAFPSRYFRYEPPTREGAKRKPAPEKVKPTERAIYARFPFISDEDPTVQYESTVYKDGSDHCTCQGFRYRQDCKHVQLLRQPASATRRF